MPQPGDFGVVPVGGWGGKLIRLGQRLIGCGSSSRYEHAFLVLDNGELVQGQPGGAVIAPLSSMAHRAVVYSNLPLTDTQRSAIVSAGRSFVGTPYSWVDYAAIGLSRLGIPSSAVRRYVADSKHMICSQLVDAAYQAAGVQLFPDHRQPGEVAPADLARLIGAH